MKARSLQRIVTGQPARDGAGVELVRVIGQQALPELDPFLLLDAFRSDDPNDYIAGFPPHPHRGFETVTYILHGRMRHRDNRGNEGVIEAGGIQWMTAARGIVHSEMPEQQGGLLEGFQLWINLPAAHKMDAPAYQEHDASAIPTESRDGASLRVICGTTSAGTSGPVRQPLTDPLYLDVSLDAGTRFEEQINPAYNAFAYVIDGSIDIADDGGAARGVTRDQLALLGVGERAELQAGANGARLLLIAGKPLREPIARAGPFVMNSERELQQAFADFQNGKF